MTQRLVYLAGQHWPVIDGMLASQGVDPLSLPWDRFLNTIYWWATRDATSQAVAKFEAQLWRPPPNEAPAPGSPWSPEAETAAFKALKAGVSAVVG